MKLFKLLDVLFGVQDALRRPEPSLASPRLPALVRAIALLAGSNDPYLRMMFDLVPQGLELPCSK